jgi:phage terminase large subunit-like protein
MVDLMRAGTKSRRQALMIEITNSGADKTSVCWAHHEYGAKVSAGTLVDDAFFAYVCANDEGDDPLADESCWLKTNPSLKAGIPGYKYLREQVTEARGMPGKESTARRLNFCQWVGSISPWIGPDIWLGAKDAEFDAALLVGRRCYGGLDLSSTTDLTALVWLFEPTETDKHWRQISRFWLPADALGEKAKRDRVDYPAWRAGGWLETTQGAAIDKRFVLARIVADLASFNVVGIAFDRWRIEDLRSLASDEGVELPIEPFGQGYQSMGPAVDEYERLLVSGDLKHDGNPIMTWNAASAVVDTDPAGNRKPTKARSTGRIDGLVAAVMAAGRAASNKDDSAAFDEFLAAPLIA